VRVREGESGRVGEGASGRGGEWAMGRVGDGAKNAKCKTENAKRKTVVAASPLGPLGPFRPFGHWSLVIGIWSFRAVVQKPLNHRGRPGGE
jgi:hypothetical protein